MLGLNMKMVESKFVMFVQMLCFYYILFSRIAEGNSTDDAVTIPRNLYNTCVEILGSNQQREENYQEIQERLVTLTERFNDWEQVRTKLLEYYGQILALQKRLTQLEAVKDSIYEGVIESKSNVDGIQQTTERLKSDVQEISVKQEMIFGNISDTINSIQQNLDHKYDAVNESFRTLRTSVEEELNAMRQRNSSLLEIEQRLRNVEEDVNTMRVNLTSLQERTSNRNVYYFTGGNDVATESEWMWSKSKTRISYSNWCPDQPDDYHGQDCLSLGGFCSFKWDDAGCDGMGRFICEIDGNPDQANLIG